MDRPEFPEKDNPFDPFGNTNSYFCNPYNSGLEQYGLEFLDRNPTSDDEIESVVILGYN